MVQALLQAGADANGQDLRGSSVLALAAVRQDRAIAELLQKYGAVLNAPSQGHDLPLREALRRGRLDEAGALVRIGADVNATTAGGDSLLAEVAGFSVRYSSGAAGNYFSEITAFHLRFDNQPYNFPPYAESIVTDNEGLRWLRIPVNSPLGQTVVLNSGQLPLPNGTEPGEHTFQVKVEDLQGETDPTPASFKFYLHNYIEPANRDGILIIDDDTNHPSYSPDAIVAAKYESMLSDYNGTKTYIKRSTLATPGNTIPDARDRHLAFSDLQKYKLVVDFRSYFL